MPPDYRNPLAAFFGGFGPGLAQGAQEELAAQRKQAMEEEQSRNAMKRATLANLILSRTPALPAEQILPAMDFMFMNENERARMEPRVAHEQAIANLPPLRGVTNPPVSSAGQNYLLGKQAFTGTVQRPKAGGAGRRAKPVSELLDVAIRAHDANLLPPGSAPRILPPNRRPEDWAGFLSDFRGRVFAEHGREPTKAELHNAALRYNARRATVSEMGQ